MTKKAPTTEKATKKSAVPAVAVSTTGEASKKVTRGTMHPKYREITVTQTDGSVFKTRSTYRNDTLMLDIDTKTHPAWTREANYINTKNSEVAKFNARFAGLSFGVKK